MDHEKQYVVIIGAGDRLAAALTRDLAKDHALTLAARNGDRMRQVEDETTATTVLLDSTDETAVSAMLDDMPAAPRVVIYIPSARVRGPVTELDAGKVRKALDVTAIGPMRTHDFLKGNVRFAPDAGHSRTAQPIPKAAIRSNAPNRLLLAAPLSVKKHRR